MTIDSVDDSNISNRTVTTNQISNRTYDSKSNRITKLRRALLFMFIIFRIVPKLCLKRYRPTYLRDDKRPWQDLGVAAWVTRRQSVGPTPSVRLSTIRRCRVLRLVVRRRRRGVWHRNWRPLRWRCCIQTPLRNTRCKRCKKITKDLFSPPLPNKARTKALSSGKKYKIK